VDTETWTGSSGYGVLNTWGACQHTTVTTKRSAFAPKHINVHVCIQLAGTVGDVLAALPRQAKQPAVATSSVQHSGKQRHRFCAQMPHHALYLVSGLETANVWYCYFGRLSLPVEFPCCSHANSLAPYGAIT